jgi:hypothetical protein
MWLAQTAEAIADPAGEVWNMNLPNLLDKSSGVRM